MLLPLGVGAIAALLLVRNRIPAWGWALVFITAVPAIIAAGANRRARAAPLPSSRYTLWDDGESVVLQRSCAMQAAKSAGATAALVVTPYYNKSRDPRKSR